LININKILQAKRNKPSNKIIYHCCVQKTASQWFAQLFNDPYFSKQTGFQSYRPKANFIPRPPKALEQLQNIPPGVIVSPLYIRFEDFKTIHKPHDFRAFFIMRDPRDLIISDYFSLKYSHAEYHPYITEMRKKLNTLSEHDGIMERILNFTTYYETLRGWLKSKEDSRIKIFCFEDFFINDQAGTLNQVLAHCQIDIPDNKTSRLLKKYSFRKLAGRNQGDENSKSHYRKGISKDWCNYFSPEHKTAFKELTSELLIELGYEKTMDW